MQAGRSASELVAFVPILLTLRTAQVPDESVFFTDVAKLAFTNAGFETGAGVGKPLTQPTVRAKPRLASLPLAVRQREVSSSHMALILNF